ncbi:MAG: HlyD family efflux transporter periplasmic adaptor subunit [Deltaproteobacteria bacterium]|nr:HlyD family efflux transporter periplasmic adaptor subunit [Deltaproteobacteria bacterium]
MTNKNDGAWHLTPQIPWICYAAQPAGPCPKTCTPSQKIGLKSIRLSPVILTLLFLLSVTGCNKYLNGSKIKLSGTLELYEHSLGSRVAGRLVTKTVEEGDAVKKDQMIGTFERYEQASRDYKRINKLYESGGATQQQVEEAALTLEDQQIKAPLDGVILTVIHEIGEVVAAGSPVVTLGDRSKLWVRVFVPEGTINRVRMDQPATIAFDGLSKKFKGHVTTISPMAEFTPRNVQTPEERVTQTFSVKVTMDETPDYIRSGVTAEVTLPLENSK